MAYQLKSLQIDQPGSIFIIIKLFMMIRQVEGQAHGLHHPSIMLTCPCNVDPLTPFFYIVKFGSTRVYLDFLFCSKTEIVGTR